MSPTAYLAVISPTRTGWSGSVVDLPGCVATGRSREAIVLALSEGIALHLALLTDDQDPIPPSVTKQVDDLTELEEAVWIDPAPINPVSQAVYRLIQQSGLSLRGLAEQLQMPPSALHRLQDPFYWGHSVSSLRRLASGLDQELHIEFRPKP